MPARRTCFPKKLSLSCGPATNPREFSCTTTGEAMPSGNFIPNIAYSWTAAQTSTVTTCCASLRPQCSSGPAGETFLTAGRWRRYLYPLPAPCPKPSSSTPSGMLHSSTLRPLSWSAPTRRRKFRPFPEADPQSGKKVKKCSPEPSESAKLGRTTRSNANQGWQFLAETLRSLNMTDSAKILWRNEEGQDIAEYAVMLAVILVIVIGTVRLIGGNANNVFSSVASSIK